MSSGSISSMISSLKSNKRNRPSAFNKLKNIPKGKYKSRITDKKSTPFQLKQIREKLREENKKNLVRKLLIFSFIFLIIIYFIGFHKF